jgi:hypothetical protein
VSDIHLVNGSPSVRQRNSEGCALLACGCAHDDIRWLQLCESHWLEWSGLHDASRIAHAATLEQRHG